MGLNIIEKIQSKIEIFRLEQRYTRRRNRRSTFQSNAIYVDGEYIYQTPNSTGSSSSSGPRINALHEDEPKDLSTSRSPEKTNRKKLHRFSSIPSFGPTGSKPTPDQDWRGKRASVIVTSR